MPFLKKPEVVLEQQLQANPYHPFQLAADVTEDQPKGRASTM